MVSACHVHLVLFVHAPSDGADIIDKFFDEDERRCLAIYRTMQDYSSMAMQVQKCLLHLYFYHS